MKLHHGMNKDAQDRLDRLPKWAQREMLRLDSNVRSLIDTVMRTSAVASRTELAVADYGAPNQGRKLPCRTVKLGDLYVCARDTPRRGVVLEVMSQGLGDLVVMPSAGNVVHIALRQEAGADR